VVARVEIRCGLLGVQNSDGGGQQAVHGLLEVGERDGVGEGKRGHLRQGMHAGVGPSGAQHGHRLAFNLLQHGFEGALDGRQSGLHLPAVEFGSVVGDRDSDAPHRASFTKAGSPA
jgi:hypothetical protein